MTTTIAPYRDRVAARLADRTVDERAQLIGSIESVIDDEREPRRVPQTEPPSDLPAQESTGMGQPDACLLGAV